MHGNRIASFHFNCCPLLFLVFLQRNLEKVKDLNWAKFIADELHKALSKGKPTKGCLLFYNVSAAAFPFFFSLFLVVS